MAKDLKNRIIIFREKHGERIFLVETEEKLRAVALKIVTERYNEGYWYENPEAPEKPAAMLLTAEQLDVLSGTSVRRAAEDEIQKYKNRLKNYERDSANYSLMLAAVDEKDGKLAYEILKIYDDGEYQGWTLEYLEDV